MAANQRLFGWGTPGVSFFIWQVVPASELKGKQHNMVQKPVLATPDTLAQDDGRAISQPDYLLVAEESGPSPRRPDSRYHRYHIDTTPAPDIVAWPSRFKVRVSKIGLIHYMIQELIHYRGEMGVVLSRPCMYGVFSRPVGGLAPVEKKCVGCLRCTTQHPDFVRIERNPARERLGDSYFTARHVDAIAYEAETGMIPVKGAGYRGRFGGEGWDGMWTDMSEIVRPTRDGIHGRETISTAIDLGRRPEALRFDASGQLLTELPPVVEIPIPILFALPEGAAAPVAVIEAVLWAAHRLGTLAFLRLADWRPEWEAYREAVALRLTPAEIGDAAKLLRAVRLVEIEESQRNSGELGEVLKAVARVKAVVPRTVVAVRLPLDEAAAERSEALCRAGVEAVHLVGSDGLNDAPGSASSASVLTERLPAVHRRLVEARCRDAITLLASGAVAMAEHVPKAIILGADGVAIDWPLWAALECRLDGQCRAGRCACGLDGIEPNWGAQRIVNLMASWHNQLLEVLGAMGLREVRRLRGERGRAMFASELEQRVFIPLVAVSYQPDNEGWGTKDETPSSWVVRPSSVV